VAKLICWWLMLQTGNAYGIYWYNVYDAVTTYLLLEHSLSFINRKNIKQKEMAICMQPSGTKTYK